MFAVVVTLQITSNRMADFMPLMQVNAQSSLHSEEGCHRFDIATDPARPDEVFLYELYTNAAAFETHCATDHFKAFDASTTDMIAAKDVRTFGHVIS